MIALQLLDDAIAAMAELHGAITPDENEDDAMVPAAAMRKFVDAHARLMYERAHMVNGPNLAEELRSVMRYEGQRMGVVSAGLLKMVINQLESFEGGTK